MDKQLLKSYFDYNLPIGSTTRHGVCPYCGRVSRKGFIVTRTDTGFVCWCHSCHKSYGTRDKSIPSISQCLSSAAELKAKMKRKGDKLQETIKCVQRDRVRLPLDVTSAIPAAALCWLASYNVTDEEVQRLRICWSPKYERLILPIYENGKLVYWQGRYFGRDGNQPKYINTKTSRKTVWFDTGKEDTKQDNETTIIVLVEDILSALAVTRHTGLRAIALLGSFVSDELIIKLLNEQASGMHLQVVVWLDYDKRAECIATTKRLNVFGIESTNISTPKDPKAYKPSRILKEVNHATSHFNRHRQCDNELLHQYHSQYLRALEILQTES